MIRLSLLGPLELRAADGTEIRSVLSQPKRLVLLAHLAVTPGAFLRRDTLLALFWPELDQARARATLRQAVYHLRQQLGANVIINRGDDELGVDPARLWCDVAAFRHAVQEKRSRDAAELYRGDLLNGVFVGEAPELERWVEEERARLRSMASAAIWALADEELAAGNLSLAPTWARRAVELNPDDEVSVRRLMTLLSRSGDRAGALRAYQDLARRLEREYEATPSAATQALIEQIRAAGPESAQNSTSGPESEATPGTGPASALAPESIHARRPPSQTLMIAVLPFSLRGQPEYEYLGEGMADLLALAIDGTDSFDCVDSRALLNWIAREGAKLPDAERRRAACERFGADLCLLGGIVQSGDRLRAHAALYDAAAPEEPRVRVTAEADLDEVFTLVDRLAAKLLVHGGLGAAGEMTQIAALTTDSLPALKAYLNGEQAFRAGRITPAVEALQRAIVEDPDFTLAHYRMAVIAEWTGLIPLAQAAATRALQGADRLPINDRRLLKALVAYFEGDIVTAELLYREVLTIYPDSAEAWSQLAKLGYFLNSLRGHRFTEAKEPLECVLRLDPNNVIALVHLACVAAKEGERGEVERLISQVLELQRQGDYIDFPVVLRVLRAFALEDREEEARLWQELESGNEFTLFWCFEVLTLLLGNLAAAGRVATVMAGTTRPLLSQLFGRLMLAELELARGRWSAAQRELDAAAHLDPLTVAVHRALLALVAFRDPGPDELRALRQELLAAPAGGIEHDSTLTLWFAAHTAVLEASRTYLLGLLHARLGEIDEAEACARRLEGTAGDFAQVAHARDAARGIRASLAQNHLAGSGEALALLEGCQLAAPAHSYIPSPLYGRLHERHLRARLLAEVGRDAEAERWFAALGEDSPHGFIYLATSHLWRAELLERRGEHAGARTHYLHFLDLWRKCDPELRPLVAIVERRLESPAPPPAQPATNAPAIVATPPLAAPPSAVDALPGTRVAPPPAPARPSRRALAASLVAIAVLIVAGILAMTFVGEREPPVPARIVVGRIEDATGTNDPGLAPTLQSMLATNFARLRGIEVVSEMRVHELIAQFSDSAESSSFASAHLLRAARTIGANQILEGTLYRRIDGGFRLELRGIDLITGAVRAAYAVQGESLFDLADNAAASLAAELGVAAPAPGFAAVTTGSLVAYRFYEEGLREFYAGDPVSALGHFRAALVEDSAFAMAAYYAARSSDIPHSTRLLQRAVQFAQRASDRERLTIEAAWAAFTDDPRRLPLAETLAVRYPAEPAGHLALGQARIWSGDFLGALPHLQRVVAMDSAGLRGGTASCRACDALWEITTAYQLADSLPAAERVAREWSRRQPRSATPWIALGFALEGQGRYAEAMAATDSATIRQPANPATGVRTGILLRAGDFDDYERMLRELFRFGGLTAKEEALWYLALGLRTQGRMEEALETTRQHYRLTARPNASPAELISPRSAEAQALFDAGRTREAAASFEALAKMEFASESVARNARHRAWMLTHAATAHAALGDTSRLRLLADSVQHLGRLSAFARDQRLHHHIRGLLLQAQGRSDEAVAEFRSALFSPLSGYTRTNFELAQALLESGRPAEAIPVLEAALRGPVGASGYYLSRTEIHQLLARALEEAGREAEAIPHHQWVAAAWGRGDPVFRMRADQASQRISADLPARR
jgi:DNA-binding SARP family transcriptional activator/Tfp pilus assembly protein PilF